MPAAKPLYGVVNVAIADQRAEETMRTVVALAALVAVLAVATALFVALPLLDGQQRASQRCQTFVLTKAGDIRCIPEPAPGMAD